MKNHLDKTVDNIRHAISQEERMIEGAKNRIIGLHAALNIVEAEKYAQDKEEERNRAKYKESVIKGKGGVGGAVFTKADQDLGRIGGGGRVTSVDQMLGGVGGSISNTVDHHRV